MQLCTGIPRLSDLEQLQKSDTYRRHVQFNREFLSRHAAAMQKYGRHWGLDPFKLWSRRWEYPFTASRLIRFAETRPPQPMKTLDAGSGVTYFPWYVGEQLPQASFICCDYNASYGPMFDEINRVRETTGRVRFMTAALQELPLDEDSLDAICCISVLEHTDNYEQIVDEFVRVLKPGGLFVLTFDLSLDGKFTLRRDAAERLLGVLRERFTLDEGFDVTREVSRMSEPGILTTDHVRATEPELLPWTKPVQIAKAVQDLFKGRGWTGGFRSRTVFCLDAQLPGAA
jgi:SAM-dependent methyltransferase